MPKVIDIMKTTADWAKKHSWKNVKDSVSEFANSDTGKAIATGITAAAPVMTRNHMRAGDGIERLGQFASNINPIAGAVLSLYGAGMNAAFGSNVNWDLYDQYNKQLEDYSRPDLSAKSNTQLLNQISGLQDLNFKEGDLGTQGWFNHDLDYAVDHLNRGLMAARTSRARMVDDAVSNVDKRQDAMIEANYRAFGGPMYGYISDGAIAYDMAKDSLMAKLWNAQNKKVSSDTFAKGGSLFTDFDMGVSFINAGGSHEKNPFGGVPMGMGEDGKQNVVEEGEAIYKDYVFSKRLPVPKAIRNKYKMRGTTFSDVFKEYFKKNGLEERENDDIAQRGLMAFATELMMSQEMIKAKRQSRKDNVNSFELGGDTDATGRKIIHDRSKTRDNYFNNLYADGSDYMTALNWYNDPAHTKERDALIADINAGKYDTDIEKINGVTVTPDNWYHLATDYLKGPVHNAILANIKTVGQRANPYGTLYGINPTVPWNFVVPKAKGAQAQGNTPGEKPLPQYDLGPYGLMASVVSPPSTLLADTAARAEAAARMVDAVTPTHSAAARMALASGINKGPEDAANSTGNGATSVTSPYSTIGNRARMAGLLANVGALEYNLMDPYRPGVLDEISDFSSISGTPVGIYAPEYHSDITYAANQAAQQAAATKSAILNSISPNRYANLLAADYNAQTAHGQLLRDAAIADYEGMLKAKGFNRETDKYNSTLDLDVAKSNMSGRQAHDTAKMQQEQYNISNYDSYKRGKDAAISQSISNIVDWLDANSREKDNLAMVAALRDSGALASNDAMDLLYNYLAGVRPTKTKSKKSKNNGEG